MPEHPAAPPTAEELLGRSELALTALSRVRRVVAGDGASDAGERVGRSQVAFRRRVGFAWLREARDRAGQPSWPPQTGRPPCQTPATSGTPGR